MALRRRVAGERRIRHRIATNVRRLRALRQISVIDISEEIGIHWRVWQRIENGETNLTLRTLVRVADALDVDPRDLLT